MYFAMFDEYDEGTAIMKAATDWSMIPTNQYFVTLSADGIWVSSDFYLRVAGAAISMAKSTQEPNQKLLVPQSQGPDYYRNGFEKRYTEYLEKEGGVLKSGIFNLDPCFHNPSILVTTNVSLPSCEIVKDDVNANRGTYMVRATGNPNSSNNALYSYKIAEVKIPVVADLQISFWKKTVNELGRYVSIDLIFKSGKKLSNLPNYKTNLGLSMDPSSGIGTAGAGWENILCKIGVGELIGDEITGITVTYDKPAATGSYIAFFDDIFISTNNEVHVSVEEARAEKYTQFVYARNQTLVFNDAALYSRIKIYDLLGKLHDDFVLESTEVPINRAGGIYIIVIVNKKGVHSQKIILL
jgi:hypothetical protein